MKRIIFLTLAVLIVSIPCWAITNPSFESGLTGWTVTGPVTTVNSFNSVGSGTTHWDPVQGLSFALLSASEGNVWTRLEQVIDADAGDTLEFSYFFQTQEPFLGADLDDVGSGLILVNQAPIATLFQQNSGNLPDQFGTPWTEVSYTFTTSGPQTLSFMVKNTGDSAAPSFLGIDDCYVGTPVAPIPEPITVLGLLIGGGSLGGYLRRRR